MRLAPPWLRLFHGAVPQWLLHRCNDHHHFDGCQVRLIDWHLTTINWGSDQKQGQEQRQTPWMELGEKGLEEGKKQRQW
jgi:hypothetical protein